MPPYPDVPDDKRFAVSPRYQVAFVDATTVFLIDERGYIALQGEGVVAVLQCLHQAPRTLAYVVAQMAEVLSEDAVHAYITRLMADGYVLEHRDDIGRKASAYWHSLGVAPRQAAERLRRARVALHVFGPVASSPLVRQLHRMDLALISPRPSTPADLVLVCTDDYRRDAVQAFNQWAWAAGQAWMLVKPVGAVPWLGPVMVPGRTACAACLAAQLQANRRAETFLAQTQGQTMPCIASVAQLPVTVDLTLTLAALEAAHWLVRDDHDRLENTFLTVELPELNPEQHHVRRIPRCPVCGRREAGSPGTSAPQEDRHRRRRPPHADAGGRVR